MESNRWRRGNEWYLPLYQGRMINQFDHRANSVGINPENTHNPYISEEVTVQQHADPEFLPHSHYWVPESHVGPIMTSEREFAVAFRDFARTTDVRTAIASIVPQAGYGNTVPLLVQQGDTYLAAEFAAMMVATLNSLCVDFVVRQKVQGTHLNLYILEQLPVLQGEAYDQQFGNVTARELVRDHVLRLTYTANDMIPFARALDYDGPPFIWDEEERLHLRTRLDALYFHLYGLSRDDADYILSTFPIVQREDEAPIRRLPHPGPGSGLHECPCCRRYGECHQPLIQIPAVYRGHYRGDLLGRPRAPAGSSRIRESTGWSKAGGY